MSKQTSYEAFILYTLRYTYITFMSKYQSSSYSNRCIHDIIASPMQAIAELC